MNARANYFKIGLFVLAALALLVAGLIMLGAGALRDQGVIMETYLDESVQGLDVGSPVKYRGVQIGNVKEIGFVGEYYPNAEMRLQRYVLVRGSLRSELLSKSTDYTLRGMIEREIEQGMRVRLASQGLTGLMYLEVDYIGEGYGDPLEISWEPKVPYVPSAPGRITLIADSLEKVAVGLEESNIQNIAANINELITTIRSTVEELSLDTLTEEATVLFEEARETNREMNDLLTSPEIRKISADVADTVSSTRELVEESRDDIRTSINNLRESTERLNEVTEKAKELLASEQIPRALENFEATSSNTREATEDIPDTLAQMRRTLKRLDMLLSTRQEDLSAVMSNIRQISENLREVSENARDYPSYTLFGAPPAPVEHEE